MTIRPGLIDEIVRNVLSELRGGSSSGGAPTAVAGTSTYPAESARGAVERPAGLSGSVATGRGDVAAERTAVEPLTLLQTVITEETLLQAGVTGCTIRVPARAVITPSGREYIRRHAIAIADCGVSAGESSAVGCVVIVDGSAAAVAAAESQGWSVQSVPDDVAAAERAASASGTRCLCCCRQPARVACLLNRRPSIRAAVVDCGGDHNELFTVMQPNVVCLRGTDGWTVVTLRRLLKALAHVPSSVPPAWNELSGGPGSCV